MPYELKQKIALPKRKWVAMLLSLAAAGPLAQTADAEDVRISESGSTLLYPLFNTWISAYTQTHPQVSITAAATGSETGIREAVAGKVNIGTSDAYMSDAEVHQHPGIINIPVAIAAQTIAYNLPGLATDHLKLDGPILAGIYTGSIRMWDAPQITAMNPGVTLPHQNIIPIHRSEGSGDTFVFSQFLTFSTPSWERDIGYGTTIAWPNVPGATTAVGNTGMAQQIQATAYAVGYVGLSLADTLAAAKLGTAALKNAAGEFVLPSKQSITVAAASLGGRTPADERLTLAFAPAPGSYPLVNYEYAIVATSQPNAAVAAAIRKFLLWSIVPSEANEAYLDTVHFIPLAPHTWELSQAQIQLIK